jgi:sarcosine oxidase gamma subunit
MVDRLVFSSTLEAGLQAALPPATRALKVSVAEGQRVLVLRHLTGGAAAVDEVLAANHLAPLPMQGTCLGNDPWLMRIGPTEGLLLTTNTRIADDVLAALRPGCSSLACVLDQSAGWLVFELLGPGVDELLPRLFDAGSIPWHAGQGARARFMDISAVVMRVRPDRVLLAVERPHASYAAQWIGHAWRATPGSMPTPAADCATSDRLRA